MTDPLEAFAAELGAPVGEVDGARIVPMLCASDDAAGGLLGSPSHLFELKLDGVRIIADRRGAAVKLSYRRLRDATATYPEVARALGALPGTRLVLDGEIVAFDEDGLPDFQRLGRRIHRTPDRRARPDVAVAYLVFDVLAVGARDVRSLPLEKRRALLERLFAGQAGQTSVVRLPPAFDDGTSLFRMCLERGLEGVVAKRRGSTYRDGDRTGDWVKLKNLVERDLVVVGWTEGEGKRARLGALDLAGWKDGVLVACGSVGSGLDEDTIDLLLPKLAALATPSPSASGKRSPARARHHVRPELVVSVRFMGVSDEGKVRAPVFRGLRVDVPVADCALGRFGRFGRFGREARRDVRAREPDAREEIEAAYATLALVGLRVEGPHGATLAVAEAARALRDLTESVGLPSVALASKPGALDVLVAVGDAPASAAQGLVAILARLATTARARVRASAQAPVPWSLVDPAHVAVPLAWDEIEAFVAAGASRDEARSRLAAGPDAAAPLRSGPSDGLAAATVALERVVARWADGEAPR